MRQLLPAIFFSLLLSTNSWAQYAAQQRNLQFADNHRKLYENKGQWPQGVLFNAKMDGGKIWVQQHKMIFHLQDLSALHKAHAMHDPHFKGEEIRQTLVHVNFVGSNEVSYIEKKSPTPYYFNYFIGNDRSKWASDVHGFDEVIMYDFYNGIDFKVSGKGDEMKYEFIVAPTVDPNVIKINYAGQKSINVDKKGNLVISTELGKIMEQKPYAYQWIDGKQQEVKCSFLLENDNLTFRLGPYDNTQSLVIDPVLVFATYDGAISDNFGMTATYGHDGTAFSAGTIYGSNYPQPDNNAYDVNSNFTAGSIGYGVSDVFISRYNATGTQMLWGTFLGGGNNQGGTETANSMICDQNNNLYVFGATSSADFPTTAGAFQTTHGGGVAAQFYYNGVYFSSQGSDIYVAKFSPDGHNLLGSTFVGGSSNDGINYNTASLPYNSSASYSGLTSNYGDQFRGEIMLDASNNVLVASCTKSTNFPVSNAFQATNGGGQDGVVFKLAANFQSMIFSSYYGGSSDDACYSLKVDESQNVVFAGGTKSNNLVATNGGWQSTNAGGTADGFVVKVSGNIILQASYVGKNQYDQVFFVEIDRNNNVYLLGQSVGGTFPVLNAPYSNGNSSNFILKMDSTLTQNLASTRFGNGSTSIHISPAAFLVDICGNIYVSGWGANILQSSPLSGMPVTLDAFQATPPNGFDFYLLVLKRDFAGILYGTYLGGNQAEEHVDGGTSRFDKNGVVYQSVCGGCGAHSDFPTTPGAWSATNNSNNCNNIIFKFNTEIIPHAEFTTDQVAGCNNFTVTFDNSSTEDDSYLWDFGDGQYDSTTFNPVITYTEAGNYQVNLYVTDSVCNLTDTAIVTITVLDSIQLNLADTLKFCNSTPATINANSNGTGTYFVWSSSPDMSNPLNAPTQSSIVINAPGGKYYVEVGNSYCHKKDSVVVVFDSPPTAQFNQNNISGCSPLSVTLNNTSVQTAYFLWDFGNGTVDSVNTNPTVTYTSPGTYTVSLYIEDPTCPASDTETATILVNPTVQVSMQDTISLCISTPITISPQITNGANTFIWSSNNQFSDTLNADLTQSSITINDPQNGYYYLNASNGNCPAMDSVYIQFTSTSISLSGDNTICRGQTSTITVTNTNPTIPLTYLWTPTAIITATTANTVEVAPQNSQYVYLTATSTSGCLVKDSIYVNVSYIDPTTVVASASQYLVMPGGIVTLSGNPSGFSSYQWTPTVGLGNPIEQQTTAIVNETTLYTLNVSDGICDVSDTVQIKVYQVICDDPYVFIPNAFSPNGDLNNDVLYVRGNFVEKMILRIFDRWGEMVFESTEQSRGWDGTFKGKKMDPDVYDFYLDVTCLGGLRSITKGNVTLMK